MTSPTPYTTPAHSSRQPAQADSPGLAHKRPGDISRDMDRAAGETVRKFRKARRMSQEQLGAALGVKPDCIAKHENGINRISVGRLFAIAAALDMPAADLFLSIPVRSA